MNKELRVKIIATIMLPLFVATIIFTSHDSAAKSLLKPKPTNIEVEYQELSFDKVVKIADAIVKLEIINKVSETKKEPYRTLFQVKVIDSYKVNRSLKKGMVTRIYQDGNSMVTVNKMAMFKNKETLLLFLKKDAKESNTYTIISGPINTYKIVKNKTKIYAIKQDKFDRLLATASLLQSGYNAEFDSKFSEALFNESYSSKRQIDIFNEVDLLKLIKEYVEEANNPFIVNYNVKSVDSKFIDSSSKFGLKIFKKEASKQLSKNVILSPLSIFTAFNIVLSGAGGQTEQQMKSVMGLEGYSKEKLNVEMNDLINYTNGSKASGMPGTTKIVNSLWISNSFKVNDKFEKDTQKYYYSDIFKVDFSSPAAIADMNNWINVKTSGLIPKAISSLEKNTSLSIFNVLYFNGKWTSPFVKANTTKEDFSLSSPKSTSTSTTTSTGKKIKVDMMNAEHMMNYYEDSKVKAGIFSYYNGNMMIIVPQGNFDEYISNFDMADIENYNQNSKYLKAKIKVPKFKIKTKNSLNTTMKELGMLLPFDPTKADLSGINSGMNSGIKSSISEKGQKLSISQVMHDCVVKVDEEGTEAAALTSVFMAGAAPLPKDTKEFYVDKPFLFVIQGNGNLMLFIGKVENPLDL